MTISIGTIATAGERSALCELVCALRRSKRPPHELLIGVMCNERLDLPHAGFRIRQFLFNPEEVSLPLARRAIAAEAGGEHIVWVEPDSVPHKDFIGDCARAFEQGRTVKAAGTRQPGAARPASVVPLPFGPRGDVSIRAA